MGSKFLKLFKNIQLVLPLMLEGLEIVIFKIWNRFTDLCWPIKGAGKFQGLPMARY